MQKVRDVKNLKKEKQTTVVPVTHTQACVSHHCLKTI